MAELHFTPDWEHGREHVRRIFDLLSAFLAGDNAVSMRETERLLGEGPTVIVNALSGLAAITSGLVRRLAEDEGVEPLDYLRAMEQALEDAHRGDA